MILGEKGQYGYVRVIEETGKKTKKTPKHHGAAASAPTPVQTSTSAAGGSVYPSSTRMYPQSAPIMVGAASRAAILEESQEGSEWAIRIGDAPLPAWGKKRSLSQEGALEGDRKRKRIDSGCVFPLFRSALSPTCPFAGVLPLPRPLADALCWFSLERDPQVEEIATAFQFTPSEVAVYYLRVNRDTKRTRRRFEKARKLLDGMSDVE